MESTLAEEFAHIYPESVRLVGVKVRNRGEVKKLDSAGVPLRTGNPVLIEAESEVTYGIAYMEPVQDLARRFGGRIDMRQVGGTRESQTDWWHRYLWPSAVLREFSDRCKAYLGQAGKNTRTADRRPSLAGPVRKTEVLFDV